MSDPRTARERAADRRRASRDITDARTTPVPDLPDHDHPGGRGTCTPGCPAFAPTDARRRAVHRPA